jgi:hypothetical protein
MRQQLLCPNCGHHVADLVPPQSEPESIASPDGSVTRFISEACSLRPTGRISAPDFRAAYERWCVQQDFPPLTARSVGKAVALHPMITVIRSNGIRFYKGIALI